MSQSSFEALARKWWVVFKRTFHDYQEDGHSDWAAALTFYALLTVFPVLLAVVAFVGLIGGPAVRPLMDNFDASAPGGAVSDIVFMGLGNLLRSRGQAFVLMLVGIAAALWAAIGYITTFRRATNAVLDVKEDRRRPRSLWTRFGIPALFAAMLALSVVIVTFTGGLATRMSQVLGVGRTGTIVWNILKWPALVVLVAAMLVVLWRTAATIRRPNYRGVTPGITVAVILWLLSSLLFALYLANFGSYNPTYASLAAVIIFLVWLWVANNAILLGVKFDADLRRSQAAPATPAGSTASAGRHVASAKAPPEANAKAPPETDGRARPEEAQPEEARPKEESAKTPPEASAKTSRKSR